MVFMENSAAIAERIFELFQAELVDGLTKAQAKAVKTAYTKWIQAKLDQYNPELYTEDEYIDNVIPDEIRYQFDGANRQERYERAVTAYDQLRVRLISNNSYERARQFLGKQGDATLQKVDAESDLKELKEIESRLSQDHPKVYKQVKRPISESKLDCMYVIRDGGAASLRLGRVIQRMQGN
jgi:hypothetical protein